MADDHTYGRANLDVQTILVAGIAAKANLSTSADPMTGEVLLAAVADEGNPKGTEAVLETGWKTETAFVTEPTSRDKVTRSYKSLVRLEPDIHGVDAIGRLSGNVYRCHPACW